MAAQRKHKVETTFIHLWAETGCYSLEVNSDAAAEMRRLRIDLTDIAFVLKTGAVVKSDMLDSKGLWNIRGRTVEDAVIEIVIVVVSAEYKVELIHVMMVQRR